MSTVYILGAGASRHVGYPLISDMGKESLDWMKRSPGGYFRAASEFLVKRFGEAPNIEDVITELESKTHSLAESHLAEDKTERMKLGNVRRCLLEAIREWFRQIRLHPASAYARLADAVVQPGDTVLTFNYDDSLERELRRAGKWDASEGYGFALGDAGVPSPTLVLKPHGSINWLASVFGGRTSGTAQIDPDLTFGQMPVIHRADLEFLGYADFSGRVFGGGGALVSLIPPGRTKEFFYRTSVGIEWEDFFGSLWMQAEESLKKSDKLVVCGYSMLAADERARDIILGAAAGNPEVQVVSGSQGQRIATDFRNAGYKRVSFDPSGRFEHWVEKVAAGDHALTTR